MRAMPVLKKINVVFLYVDNMQAQREFYENTVGFTDIVFKTPNWIEYRLQEGAHFAMQQSEPGAMDDIDRARNTIKFSIVVDDIQAAYEELAAKGVQFLRLPEKGYGFLICEFSDPEGNALRLLQYTTMKVKE